MLLKNKTQREEFLNNYKEWGVWLTVPELEMTYYRKVLPNGTQLIASEYIFNFYDYLSGGYRDKTEVKYHIILSEGDKWDGSSSTVYMNAKEFKHFHPSGCSMSTMIKYLTETRPEV